MGDLDTALGQRKHEDQVAEENSGQDEEAQQVGPDINRLVVKKPENEKFEQNVKTKESDWLNNSKSLVSLTSKFLELYNFNFFNCICLWCTCVNKNDYETLF